MADDVVASAPEDDDVDAPHLEAARRRLGVSMDDLWVCYIGLGGRWSLVEFTGYLAGTTRTGVLEHRHGEHEVVAQAIDEQSMGDDETPPA